MYDLLKSLLFRLDAEVAHDFSIGALSLAEIIPELAHWNRNRVTDFSNEITVAGIKFPGPIGLAAGLDKNAKAILGFGALGFHFVEVGTVTPKAQPGNDKPRLFRLLEDEAIINRFGFNNEGMQALANRIRDVEIREFPIGINIGKNKSTPLELATHDYVSSAKFLAPLADYLVVNLSSPNTPGLRSLQNAKSVASLIQSVQAVSKTTPVFLKIAPDLESNELDELVDVAMDCNVSGLICTNTTLDRNVSSRLKEEAGGLSGKPLFEKSTQVLKQVFRRSAGRLPLIGVGGIFSGEDAWKKVCAGASLVQLYSGFIYRGPVLIREINETIAQKLKEHGLKNFSEAVGRDA
jgi:dihydroorotate dehydrogenase